MHVDHERAIRSDLFSHTDSVNGIVLQFSGIESLKSLSAGERYHTPLRGIFWVLMVRHPTLHLEMCLRVNLKGINDTMGSSGLIHTMLSFGALPSLEVSSTAYPMQVERMRALQTAREELYGLVAKARIAEALSFKLPQRPLPAPTRLREGCIS